MPQLAPQMSLGQLPLWRDSSGVDEMEGITMVLTRLFTFLAVINLFLLFLAAGVELCMRELVRETLEETRVLAT